MLCAVLSLFLVLTVVAQEKKISQKNVPPAVLAAFEKAYPHAKIKGTSTEVEHGKTYFEIESVDGTQARDILYLADGTVVEIEEAVAAGALPGAVKSAISEEFVKAKITKAEKTTKGTEISYEVHISLGSKRGSIVVDPTGKVLEKNPLKVKKEKTEKEEA
jgi:glycine cleavage system H lipoate-binding protein